MTTQEENSVLGQVDAVLDVSVVVPSCFENPLKKDSVRLVRDTLNRTRAGALLPTSAILGTYHIVTSYLGVSRVSAKNILAELLNTHSPALYGEITTDLASLALDYAATLNIESWDGYLLAVAKKFDARRILSLDQELAKSLGRGEGIVVQNPFDPNKTKQYHRFLEDRKL
jgi:predicted nucleic acid-binding protein